MDTVTIPIKYNAIFPPKFLFDEIIFFTFLYFCISHFRILYVIEFLKNVWAFIRFSNVPAPYNALSTEKYPTNIISITHKLTSTEITLKQIANSAASTKNNKKYPKNHHSLKYNLFPSRQANNSLQNQHHRSILSNSPNKRKHCNAESNFIKDKERT